MVKIPLYVSIAMEKKAFGAYERIQHVVYLHGLKTRYQSCPTELIFCELSVMLCESTSKDEQ